MTWFKVDDRFHSHLKVLATDPAALGLWVVAGSWSSANLTEGFVPDHALPRLLPGSDELAKTLVATGLWKRVRGGHRFHDWTEYNPTAEEEKTKRRKRSEAGRKGGLASGKARSKPRSKPEANASRDVQPPSRPVPSASKEAESPTGASAQTIVGEWIERCTKRPPGSVIGQVSKHVKVMLEEGIDPDDVRRGLAAWMSKALHPSTLPSVVNEVMNHRPTECQSETTRVDRDIARLMSTPLRALPGGQT